MQRISVVGTSGSGKTTTAQHISRTLKIPHIELDALNWEADWQATPVERLRQKVEHALTGDSWVVDGNYGSVRDIIWSKRILLSGWIIRCHLFYGGLTGVLCNAVLPGRNSGMATVKTCGFICSRKSHSTGGC